MSPTLAESGKITDEELYNSDVNEYDAYGNVIKDTKELANIKAIFTYKNNGESIEVNVPNVPYQRNFRTNIIGDIFTTDVKLEIIIDEEFYKPDNLVELK